ncbi:MAG: hypothetical protein FWC16_14480 [Defluviitaleaceae bacterium]|nr:hypothetical protein [Defluviitaleaceae bacterium]MCL2276121.1 hypothetical protein [Defluviitaleaceae bacterium]
MRDMIDIEIMELTADDFRELTPQEIQQDNFRRMFQMLGLIYANQVEIKQMLVANNHPTTLV